jgi:hypothetical protein
VTAVSRDSAAAVAPWSLHPGSLSGLTLGWLARARSSDFLPDERVLGAKVALAPEDHP